MVIGSPEPNGAFSPSEQPAKKKVGNAAAGEVVWATLEACSHVEQGGIAADIGLFGGNVDIDLGTELIATR